MSTLPILEIPVNNAYTNSVGFNTSIVNKFEATEQRKALQFNPVRTFSLPLENTPANREYLESFFISALGAYGRFLWHWDETIGGSGQEYVCHFSEDVLEQNVKHYGYSQLSLNFCAIDDENILKNRYFLGLRSWESTCECRAENGTLIAQNTSDTSKTLSQSSVMKLNAAYRLEITCQISSGSVKISSQSSNKTLGERLLTAGINTHTFISTGNDLIIELEPNTSAVFERIELFALYDEVETLQIPSLIEHSSKIIFSTLKDEILTYQNNRKSLQSIPLRRWVLTFEKSPQDLRALEAFFVSKKGRFRAFDWLYSSDAGGDDEIYKVRFDTDTFTAKRDIGGFGRVELPIHQVL